MSQDQPRSSRILQYAAPTDFRSLASRALRWTVPWAVALALVYGLLTSLHALLSPGALSLTLGELLQRTVLAVVLLALLLFPARLLWISPAMDSVFKVLGFLATFFGLGMLFIFCLSLAHNTYDWFVTTGQLVRLGNYKVERQLKELENLKHLRAVRLQTIRDEMQAELDTAESEDKKKEITQDYENRIIPETLKDYDGRLAQLKITAEKDYRPDWSGFGILAHFLTHGASSDPQDSGIVYALFGSLYVALITLLFAVPVGIASALYLEEYRGKGWLGNLIQININNLAGVPSVVYGILGGFVFVELIFKGLVHHHLGWPDIAPRNILGGGLTLGLLTLPVVIVSSQEAIRAVPRSIRDGAYALGATQWQTIWRNVLPMATPGIMTGTILSISRAIGEAAPMVLFGALLFVDSPPHLLSRFTVVPMQIFNWVDQPKATLEALTSTPEQLRDVLATGPLNPARFDVLARTQEKAQEYLGWIQQTGVDRPILTRIDQKVIDEGIQAVYITPAWHENAAMAIVVLLLLLLTMNAVAIWLRNRAQQQLRY